MASMWEAADHLRRLIPIGRWTPLLALLGLALSMYAWRPVSRRLGWRPLPTSLAVLSLLAALTLTLTPKAWYGNHRTLAQCLPADAAGWARAAGTVGHGLESCLNIAMLVPLGFFLVLACRRVVWPAALTVTLPAAIELTQVVVPGRECSPSDWYANALGGLLGVAAGAVVGYRHRAREAARPPAQRDALTRS
jgi:VanZ family protein